MSKILITGGTVFVSKFLAEYFIGEGNEVYVFNRGSRQQSEGAHLIKGNKKYINKKLSEHFFDIVIAVNIYTKEEMKNLLDGLKNFGDFIFISSSAVYCENNSLPFKETSETGKNSIWRDYGINKLEAENYLLRNIPRAYILRPPYLYGKYQNLYSEGFVFDCAMKGLPFYIPKKGTMPLQFCHVFDLCLLIQEIVRVRPKSHIMNVGNRELTDINGFVEMCYDIVGAKLEKIYVDSSHQQRSYFPFHDYNYYLDVTKQYDIIPQTVPLYRGLQKDFEYYKSHQDEVMKKQSYFDYIEKYLKK